MCSYRPLVHVLSSFSSERTAGFAGRQKWLLVSSILFIVLLVSSHAAGQAEIDDSKRNAIHGIVVNSVTREPIGRALVYSPDNRFATLTDDQGRFEFALPESPATSVSEAHETFSTAGANYIGASYSNFPVALLARKPGFLGLEKYSASGNQTLVVTEKEVTIGLVPEARIVGRVVLPNSNGADRISVQLYRRTVMEGRAHWLSAGEVSARTNGEFRFAELERGTYKLFTEELMDRDPITFDPRGPIYGYPPVYFPNATDFESAGTIELTPGMTLQAELAPGRQPYYPVKVPVTNGPTNDDLQVSVAVRGRKGPGFALGYNRDDQMIEGALPNGTYVIEARSLGGVATTGSISLAVKGGAVEGPSMILVRNSSVRIEAKMELRAKAATNAQNENTRQEVSSEGQLREQGREQNFNARLEPADDFTYPETPNWPSSVTQHDDTAVFENVPPRRYWVRIDARGFAASVTSGEVDLLRRPLTVGPGSNPVVHLTLRDDDGEISGSIEDPGAAGAESSQGPGWDSAMGRLLSDQRRGYVFCIPLPESTGEARQEAVMADGKFDVQHVPPGSYRVLAFDRLPKELEYHNSEAMRAYEGKGQIVRLGAGQKENVKLQLISTSE
jgi:hypothetical protein